MFASVSRVSSVCLRCAECVRSMRLVRKRQQANEEETEVERPSGHFFFAGEELFRALSSACELAAHFERAGPLTSPLTSPGVNWQHMSNSLIPLQVLLHSNKQLLTSPLTSSRVNWQHIFNALAGNLRLEAMVRMSQWCVVCMCVCVYVVCMHAWSA